MSKSLLSVPLLALTLLAASPVQAQGSIELKNTAEVETTVKTADGRIERRRGPVLQAVPGTEVIYTTSFRNVGKRPAGGIVIKNPVPQHTTLIAASPWGQNADISYSADGGRSWAAADRVRVSGPDGRERAAGLSEITHVRWSLRGELPPGKQGEVGFRVVIR